MLFSVLYGFWVANYVAFNGDAMRELAAQFLALAEKQRATAPLMIGHRLMGTSLCLRETSRKAERISIRRSRFTILRSIVRWRRVWPGHRGGNLILSVVGSVVARLSRGRARRRRARAQGCARDRSRRHVDVCAGPRHRLPISPAETTRQQTHIVDELVALADEKGALFWKALGMMHRGCVLALTGKASDAVQMIDLRDRRIAVNGSNTVDAVVFVISWRGPMRNLANSMTLGAALAKR